MDSIASIQESQENDHGGVIDVQATIREGSLTQNESCRRYREARDKPFGDYLRERYTKIIRAKMERMVEGAIL
jgi:hypothetical protein